MSDLTLAMFADSPGDRRLWGDGPLLVVRPGKPQKPNSGMPDEDTFVFDTPSKATLVTSGSKIEQGSTGEYLMSDALVIPVRKTDGNPFPLVSVGRARNNDVCLQDPSVSKVHAYFVAPDKPGALWGLKDAKSLNGTVLLIASGPQRVATEVVLVDHGAELRFGVVKCLFTDHETLMNAVLWASKSWKK